MTDLESEALEPLEQDAPAPEAEAPEPEAAPEIAPEVIDQARKYGWKGPDEWQGAPPKKGFMRPDEYLDLPQVQNKILREEMSEFRKAQEAKERETADKLARMDRMYQEAAERRADAHKREVERLKAEQRKAVETGDVERWEALEKEQEALGPVPQQQKAEQQADPEVTYIQNWIATIPPDHWWHADEIARAASGVIYNQAPPTLTPAQKIAFVEQRIKDRFYPEQPQKPRPARVDGGGLAMGGKKRPSERIPAEALAVGKRFVEEGLFKDIDEYAKSYLADEGA